MALQVSDELFAQMAIGLLARIGCHVAPENVEWLRLDPDGFAITRGAHHPRAHRVLYRALDGGVELFRRMGHR